MKTVNISKLKFRDENGNIYGFEGSRLFSIYSEENKGYISLDGGKTPYTPVGGRKTCSLLLVNGALDLSKVNYIQSVVV